MMKLLDVSGFSIEIDIEATANAYGHQLGSCDCVYCRNFYSASCFMPSSLIKFLGSLGVDSSNPVYISEICQNSDGSHLYSIYYDVVGRIISSPVSSEGSSHMSVPISLEGIPESINVRIAVEPYAPGHFPSPAIEFQFLQNLAWVLDENP